MCVQPAALLPNAFRHINLVADKYVVFYFIHIIENKNAYHIGTEKSYFRLPASREESLKLNTFTLPQWTTVPEQNRTEQKIKI